MPLDQDVAYLFDTLLGSKGFSRDNNDIAPWLTDWRGVYHGRAAALLSPETTAQVAEIIRIAAAHRIPIVPQGGNTSMVGGATPSDDGVSVILSLRRMNKIRALDAEAGTAVAEAGVILETLHLAAAAQHRRFPLTLGAKGSATIGGLIASNAGGTQVLRFGTMRKLVLGLEAVLPDGSVFNGLAALKKDNRGYDLTQLLVGSEGTIGIVTAASLRLAPAIADRAAAWVGVDSPQAALALLRFMDAGADTAIESFEIVAAESLDLVFEHISGTRPPLAERYAWQLLIEYVEMTPGRNATDAVTALVGAAHEAGLIQDAVIAKNEAEIAMFWHIRDSISAAERASGPAIQHDISVPIDAMPDFMVHAAAAVEQAFPGVSTSAFGHLGDGNVHFHVRAPAGTDAADAAAWRAGQGKAASQLVYDLVTAADGSISAEHGIGQMKRAELLRLSDPARIAAMRAIKAAFDPLGIMNPGKLVPLASDAAGE